MKHSAADTVKRLRKSLRMHARELILLLVILLIGVVVTSVNPNFFHPQNLLSILSNYTVMGIMAVGMMMVIATGNIDVSVGAQFAVCGMIAAHLSQLWNGEHPLFIFLAAVAVGTALGLCNGFFVAKLQIPAIIVTLATLSLLRGGLILFTDGVWVEQLRGPFTRVATARIGAIGALPLFWAAILLLTWALLYKTRMGLRIMAVGSNPAGALRVGIRRTGVYLFAFAFMGACSGLAAALNISKLAMAHPTAGGGMEMKLIAAAVIGGAAFAGGSASVSGTFLGIVLFAVIENALVLLRVPVYWQALVTGLVLLLAISSSARNGLQLPHRKRAEREGAGI